MSPSPAIELSSATSLLRYEPMSISPPAELSSPTPLDTAPCPRVGSLPPQHVHDPCQVPEGNCAPALAQLPTGPFDRPSDVSAPDSLSSRVIFERFMAEEITEPVVVHLFAGKPDRPEGFAAILLAHRIPCLEIDTLVDPRADILSDEVFGKLCRLASAGLIIFMLIGIPYSTWSVARIGAMMAPFQLRGRAAGSIHGLPHLSRNQRREVAVADEIGRRAFALALILERLLRAFIFEHPVDRGDRSASWFQEEFADHVSIFAASFAVDFCDQAVTERVDFCQCACGSEFQKRTSALAAGRIAHLLVELRRAQCSHHEHSKIASGFDEVGEAVTARTAPYPAGLNAIFAGIAAAWIAEERSRSSETAAEGVTRASSMEQPVAGLYSGSAKPHAAVAEAAAHVRSPSQRIASASLRRLEPELPEVLRLELLPAVNLMPVTVAPSPEVEMRTPPAPLLTDQLIPKQMQRRLHAHRLQVAACFSQARKGRWKWARDHRPAPLIATEAEALLPAGRGWKWEYRHSTLKWHPIVPSHWPDAPPDSDINISNLMEWAEETDPADKEIVAAMAHGYPGPELAPVAAIGSLHVGALKEIANFDKCTAKDRAEGLGKWGSKLPHVWPCRADYRNIVMRRGKARLTIDKSMRLAEWLPSHNDEVDLLLHGEIDYVSVSQLGRARAILLTAGVEVVPFGFDLRSYFRKTGKNKSTWWMACYVGDDGYGVDTRVQFGDRSAPILCGRQTCLLADAIKRELRRLDLEYPSQAASVIAYIAARLGQMELSILDFCVAALFFILMFVDDAAAWVINDALESRGEAIMITEVDGCGVAHIRQQRRGELYLAAALGVVNFFGHSEAVGKTWMPDTAGMMPFLGVSMDCERERMLITREKREFYAEDILKMVGKEALEATGSQQVDGDELNSVVHKLLHACTCIVLGRQHVHHLLRCLRVATRLYGTTVVLGTEAKAELVWWLSQLRKLQSEGVPMASRLTFPAPGPGTLAPYFDASRELDAPHSSGFGAWAVIKGEFCYVEGRWLAWELRNLSINVLELAARNIGTFTFLEYARGIGVEISHLFEFTDNKAAELSAEFGKPHTAAMQELVKRAYVKLRELGVYSSMLRIASVDNDIADGLSRGGRMLANALRIAAGAGIPIRRLTPAGEWRDLSALRGMQS